MSTADCFMSSFDKEGRFRDRDGVLDVIIMTSGGNRYPVKLHFNNGLCIRAEMEGGSPWAFPDNSPLDQIRFVLYFEGETPRVIHVDQGRIVHQNQVPERPTKKDFLTNLRVARNLFFHPQRVEADSATVDIGVITDAVARAAIWLTPKSVAGYNAADFPELGLDRQMDLQTAVQSFLAVAKQVLPHQAATREQYGNAWVAFRKILQILEPYLPMPHEAKNVEKALRGVTFPSWVVNWDYELGSDQDGGPAVWVNVFTEEGAPRSEFGRFAARIIPKIRQALSSEGVDRWPYVRVRSATEHKSALPHAAAR